MFLSRSCWRGADWEERAGVRKGGGAGGQEQHVAQQSLILLAVNIGLEVLHPIISHVMV